MALLIAATVGWWTDIAVGHVKPDERVYVEAVAHAKAGRSPYSESAFFYPPSFAVLGVALDRGLGTLGFLYILRAANLVGACVCVWLALQATRWRFRTGALVGTMILLSSEAIGVGILAGNVSACVAALAFSALRLSPSRPFMAGALLGTSLLIKPLALFFVPLLAVIPRHRRTALWSVVLTCAGLLLDPAGLAEFFRNTNDGWPGHARNLSLLRLAHCWGLEVSPLVLSSTVVGSAVALVTYRKRPDDRFLPIVMGVVSLLALPLVWVYSWVLALPVQLMALDKLALDLRRGRHHNERQVPWLQILAALALCASFLPEAAGGLGRSPLWLQGLVLCVPLFSPLTLAFYLDRSHLASTHDTETTSPGTRKLHEIEKAPR